MFNIEIINADIVTSTQSYRGCVSIQDGRIAAISASPLQQAKQTIDAAGLTLLPGMIDQHVHFMDPGGTEREDFIHGSSAAAVAGVTTVVEHSHGYPVRSVSRLDEKLHYLANRSLTDFGLAAHVFPEDIGNLEPLWQRGAVQFKIFTCTTHGVPGLTNDQLFRAFAEIAAIGANCLLHCEDDSITDGNERRLRAANRYDNGVITEWRSATAEQVAVNTVAFMARLTGVTAIVAHVSHPLVVEIIQRERAQGAKLFAEMCPQYLFLNEDIVREKGPFAKFTPPARSVCQSQEMAELINNGSVHLIASDHAPSTAEQKKEGTIWDCHFGLPGIDTTLPMMLKLVNQGLIPLQRLIQMYSEAPAKLLGLYPRKGCIAVGADADLVLVDMNKKWTIDNELMISKAGWTPFHGMAAVGKAQMTLVRGQVVAENGKIVAQPGAGRPVSRI